MLLSILKALLSIYDNTIKEINKESVKEKDDDDTLRDKIEGKLKYATDSDLQDLLDRENLSYMWCVEIHGRYKVKDELIKLGVKPVETRTGNSYTKKISVENDYPFGGEMSGHLYFRDKFIGNDDGIYAGLRLVEILSKTNKKCTELLDNIPVYYSTDENKVPVEDAIKDKIVSRVEEYAKEKGYNYLTIDGVKVLYDDGFALVRKSNTTPNITTRYEAKTKERLEEITNEYNSLLDKLKEEE